MKNHLQGTNAIVSAVAAVLVSGCAVTPGEVNSRAGEVERTIAAVPKAADIVKAAKEPAFQRIKGNYLGSGSIPLGAGNSLPSKFSRVSFNFGRSEGPFVEAAKNVRSETGLSIRLNPDIYANLAQSANSAPIAVPMGPGVVTVTPAAQPGGGPLPSNFAANRAGMSAAPAVAGPSSASAALVPAQTLVPLNFTGDLSDYLTMICSASGLSWEYDNGEIHFFRLLTRSFSVDQLQQAIDVTDITSGAGQTTLGSSTGAAGGSSTSSNNSQTSLSSKFDPWAEFVDTVKGMLTPAGKVVANRATGTFVVTDTKANVDRIGTHIAAENVKLRTRVDIEIRTITFELNEGTNIGADFNVIYRALSGKYSLTGTVPATAGAGDTTPSVITATSTSGGRYNGSSVSLSALDQYGKVINDKTDTIRARNRAPAVVLAVQDLTYLASTTPATGGGTSAGTGVPGLTPGAVTYGTFFTMIPSVSDNGTVIISYSSTESRLTKLDKASTGKDATFQQITTPALARGKNATDLVIPKGGTEISVSSASDAWSSQTNLGFTGASAARTRARTLTITLVTPYVLPGV